MTESSNTSTQPKKVSKEEAEKMKKEKEKADRLAAKQAEKAAKKAAEKEKRYSYLSMTLRIYLSVMDKVLCFAKDVSVLFFFWLISDESRKFTRWIQVININCGVCNTVSKGWNITRQFESSCRTH